MTEESELSPDQNGSKRDCQYVSKVDHILKVGKDECYLVALLVMANPLFIDNDQFRNLPIFLEPADAPIQQQQTALLQFCGRLLLERNANDQNDFAIAVARLLILLLERILGLFVDDSSTTGTSNSNSNNNSNNNFASDLMNTLLDFMTRQSQSKNPCNGFLPLTTRVVEVLNAYCSKSTGNDDNGAMTTAMLLVKHLGQIWTSYMTAMAISSLEEIPQPSDKIITSSDDLVMQRTLQAIVERIDGSTSNDSNNNSLAAWKMQLHRAVHELFRIHVLQLVVQVQPTITKQSTSTRAIIWQWFVQCLNSLSTSSSISKKNNNGESILQSTTALQNIVPSCCLPLFTIKSWREILLLFATSFAFSHAVNNNNNNNMSELLAMDPSTKLAMLQLLLIHLSVSSFDESSEDLRLLAWTTCASWVHALHGCEWMLVEQDTISSLSSSNHDAGSPKKGLGAATYLVALMRLASGEWRIQLGHCLAKLEGGNHARFQDGTLPACVQVLISLVTYMTRLAEDLEQDQDTQNHQLLLSPEALLQLRDSLEDTLQATSNFLDQCSKLKPASPTILGEEDASVILKMLAALLAEFDVFDGLRNVDTDEVLRAVHYATIYQPLAVETREHLLTSLMTILESARDDSYRVLLLKEHNLLGISMLNFSCLYWNQATSTQLRSVPTACHLMELWHGILMEHRNELRIDLTTAQVQAAIISWMKRSFTFSKEGSRANEYTEAVNAAVGCYVTLRGEAPPSDLDAQILQHAMQLCATEYSC